MSWSKEEQRIAEREWFRRTADQVAVECGGSSISGRRTRKRNASLKNSHPKSLHIDGLADDHEYDTAEGYGRAWSMGRKLGLHGYKKPGSKGIHWQARAQVRSR